MPPVHVRPYLQRREIQIHRERLAHLTGVKYDSQDIYVGRDHVGSYSWDNVGDGIAFISSVDIRADWQRKGVGRQVVTEILREMKSKGIETVELESKPKSVGFWHKMDFYETGDVTPYGNENDEEDPEQMLVGMRFDMEDFNG